MPIIASSPEALRSLAGFSACVATIGNFDGVHIGHARLLSLAAGRAHELQLPSVAITFSPHPATLLTGSPHPLLCSFEQKVEFIAQCGIDAVLVLPFTKAFAMQTAAQFSQAALDRGLHAQELFVGYDFCMGSDRAPLAGHAGSCKVRQTAAVLHGNKPVSSTRIRNDLAQGNLDSANVMLGRNFSIRGNVVHGAGRGGPMLGFPTANLSFSPYQVTPPPAVYATSARIVDEDGAWMPSVTSFCKNPTFGGDALTMETHILDFSRNIYDMSLEVRFFREIRQERRFESLQALAQQLGRDVKFRRMLDAP